MSFYEDLPDIRHQTASVSQSVTLADPASDYLVVGLVLIDCAEIARAENFRLGLDYEVLVGYNPLLLDQGQLLHYFFRGVVDKSGGPWAVDSDDCVYLVS